MTLVRICPIAWDLYAVWTDLLEAKPKRTTKEISAARRAFIKHRDNCPNCDPITKAKESKYAD